jgi:hypothetical protein
MAESINQVNIINCLRRSPGFDAVSSAGCWRRRWIVCAAFSGLRDVCLGTLSLAACGGRRRKREEGRGIGQAGRQAAVGGAGKFNQLQAGTKLYLGRDYA